MFARLVAMRLERAPESRERARAGEQTGCRLGLGVNRYRLCALPRW